MFIPLENRPVALAIAIHCSGASGRQWQRLEEELAPQVKLLAPDLAGYGHNFPADLDAEFGLDDEVSPFLDLIDMAEGPVHLIGHSYGGAVALRATLLRPNNIASLTLYEPSAFCLLRNMGSAGADALLDIEALAAATRKDVDAGRGVFAMRKFYDFWQGPGEWRRLSMDARMKLASRVAKIPLDFEVLLGDGTQLRHLRRLNVPTLVLRGEHAPLPSRLVADRVARIIPRGRIMEIAGAGHMGPISHSEAVALLMSKHVLAHTVTGAVPALMAA